MEKKQDLLFGHMVLLIIHITYLVKGRNNAHSLTKHYF